MEDSKRGGPGYERFGIPLSGFKGGLVLCLGKKGNRSWGTGVPGRGFHEVTTRIKGIARGLCFKRTSKREPSTNLVDRGGLGGEVLKLTVAGARTVGADRGPEKVKNIFGGSTPTP